MKAALAAAAAVAIAALFLRARRRLRTKKIAYINTEDAPKWQPARGFAAALQLAPEVFEKSAPSLINPVRRGAAARR